MARKSHITKGHLAVFVCMSTKAVCLELIFNLNADPFLAAFHRLFAYVGLQLTPTQTMTVF